MYNLLAVLLLIGAFFELNAEPTIEVKKNEYKPGFTNDDLMKLVFQRYGRTMKREASESAPEDEEGNYQNYQKRAYPRQIPASSSLLARYTDAFQYQPWNNLQKRYAFDRQLRSFDRSLRTPGGYAFDHLARMKKGSYAFDHLARMKKANYDFDHLARMRKANYDFDHLARMRKSGYPTSLVARM